MSFKINPLAVPPGVHPKQWLQTFAEIFCRTLSLLEGSMSLLILLLDALFREFEVYAGSANFPGLRHLLDKCLSYPAQRGSREAGFKDSIQNRLKALLTLHGEMFDCTIGFPLEQLAEKNVVFESAGMPEKHFQLVGNVILFWLMLYRIANQQRGQGIRNLLVVDECRWLFSPYENPNIGWPPIITLLSLIREFSLGVVAASQSTAVHDELWANSFTKVMMAVGSGDDLRKIRNALSLDADQVEYMHRLKVGEAVVRHPRFAKPFVIEIPRFPLG